MGKDGRKKENFAKELEEAQREIERLQDIINEKDLEVSFVVHDLKNPLSIIEMNFSLISSVLEDHEELSKLKRVSGLIESQLIAMRHLIHELLNISKMESSKHTLELQEVKIDQFLEYIREENSASVENNGLSLILEIEENAGSIHLDRNLVERVFANLIVNAVKYSLDATDIVIHAGKSDREGFVRFVIEDFGIGIPKENLEKVFNKFEHGKTKESGQRVSHGLGLYFSKLVTELHGGRIWVESEMEKGSRFIFELPRMPILE